MVKQAVERTIRMIPSVLPERPRMDKKSERDGQEEPVIPVTSPLKNVQ